MSKTHLISGQANSKLSHEMKGFCIFSEWPTVLPLNYGSQKLTHFCKQVYIGVCILGGQKITNSQADLHSR